MLLQPEAGHRLWVLLVQPHFSVQAGDFFRGNLGAELLGVCAFLYLPKRPKPSK